jgi:hypothetical protein
MSKMKNPKFFDIALATGGSHYPDVNGELLEKYGEAIVRKCAEIADNKPNTPGCGYITKTDGDRILDQFGIK